MNDANLGPNSRGAPGADSGRLQSSEPMRERPVGPAGRFRGWCRRRPRVAGLTLAAGLLLVAAAVVSMRTASRHGSARILEPGPPAIAEWGLRHPPGELEVALTGLGPAPTGVALLHGVSGPEPADPLAAERELARAYLGQGRWKAAEPLLLNLLSATERLHGPEAEETLQALTALALNHLRQDELEVAETLYATALPPARRTLGDEHPLTINTLHNLAHVCRRLSRFAEAEQYLGEAMASSRRVFGPDHRHTLVSIHELAMLELDRQRLAQGEELFIDLLNRRRSAFGATDPETLQSLRELAAFYADHGEAQQVEAAASLQRGFAAAAGYPGTDFRSLIDPMVDLAYTLGAANRWVAAEAILREAIVIARQTGPPDDPALAAALAELTGTLLARGHFPGAETSARECLEIRRKQMPDDWRTFNAEHFLGASLLGQKKHGEAEGHLLAGYRGMKQREAQIPAIGRPRLKENLEGLARLYEALGRPETAAEWRAELTAFDRESRRPGPPSPLVTPLR